LSLTQRRSEAVREVFEHKAWDGIEELVGSSENPYTVGFSVGGLDDELVEEGALGWGDADGDQQLQALRGYFFARHRKSGWEWVETQARQHVGKWSDERLGSALLAISDEAAGWRLSEELGPKVEKAYWTNFRGMPPGADLWIAARKLVKHGRPFAAVQLIGAAQTLKKGSFDPDTAYFVLEAAASATEPPAPGDVSGIDYEIGQTLLALDEAEFDESKLAQLEWVFLRVLERDPEGLKHLHRRLAREPEFFVELLIVLFRPDQGGPSQGDPDPKLVRLAQHVWTLLQTWKGPIPGISPDGSLDEGALVDWVKRTRDLLVAEHRTAIGDQQIGQVLWHSPAGSDGLHPHEAVRRVIESTASGDLNTGFRVAAVNSRGVVMRGPGGDQEREMAADYAARAAAFSGSFPQTARIFRELAERYEAEARDWDLRVTRSEG
jgi:hypothetical protein